MIHAFGWGPPAGWRGNRAVRTQPRTGWGLARTQPRAMGPWARNCSRLSWCVPLAVVRAGLLSSFSIPDLPRRLADPSRLLAGRAVSPWASLPRPVLPPPSRYHPAQQGQHRLIRGSPTSRPFSGQPSERDHESLGQITAPPCSGASRTTQADQKGPGIWGPLRSVAGVVAPTDLPPPSASLLQDPASGLVPAIVAPAFMQTPLLLRAFWVLASHLPPSEQEALRSGPRRLQG